MSTSRLNLIEEPWSNSKFFFSASIPYGAFLLNSRQPLEVCRTTPMKIFMSDVSTFKSPDMLRLINNLKFRFPVTWFSSSLIPNWILDVIGACWHDEKDEETVKS